MEGVAPSTGAEARDLPLRSSGALSELLLVRGDNVALLVLTSCERAGGLSRSQTPCSLLVSMMAFHLTKTSTSFKVGP